MSLSIHFDMHAVYKDELEALNESYPHPMEFHGETFPDAFHAYMYWNDELLENEDIEYPDGKARLDVNRVKFHDTEMRKVLMGADYKQLHTWFDYGRMLMTIRDELVLEEAGPVDQVLDAVVPSPEMRDFMKAGNFDRRKLPDLIAGSLLPLEEKVRLMDSLGLMLAEDGKRALNALELKPGEMFLAVDFEYSAGNKQTGNSRLFTSFESAMEYVKWKFRPRKNHMGRTLKPYECQWTVLEKWAPDENGHMELQRSYTLFGEDIVYFAVYESEREGYCWSGKDYEYFPNFSHSAFLTLDKPFKPGDCVTLDCRPTAPARKALVLEVFADEIHGGSSMACLVQEKGKWLVARSGV